MKDPREMMNRDQILLVADKSSLMGVLFFTTVYIKAVVGEEGVSDMFVGASLARKMHEGAGWNLRYVI